MLQCVAARDAHVACVTAVWTVWSWGKGSSGPFGHGNRDPRQRPVRLRKQMYGESPAVMVGCGGTIRRRGGHTLVLTGVGVWSCGWGEFGQLGHGDTADQLVLTRVGGETFRGAQIVTMAAGGVHSAALGVEGRVWTWGDGGNGQLGHYDKQIRLVPTLLEGEALRGAAVLVAAGASHTVAVVNGLLWVWGCNLYGQLGLGDEDERLAPTVVGSEAAFAGSQVLTADCGNSHTLVVTTVGTLWWFGTGQDGMGQDGAPCHNDHNQRLVPTRIETQHFGNAKIVSAAAGSGHSAATTEEGALFMWGDEAEGLGHADGETKLVPTRVAPCRASTSGAVTTCHQCTPSPLPWVPTRGWAAQTSQRLMLQVQRAAYT